MRRASHPFEACAEARAHDRVPLLFVKNFDDIFIAMVMRKPQASLLICCILT